MAQMIVELIRDKRKIVDRITHDQIDEFIGLLQKTQVMRNFNIAYNLKNLQSHRLISCKLFERSLTSNWEMGNLYISELSFPGFVTRPLCL